MAKNTFRISFDVSTTSKDPKLVLKRYEEELTNHMPATGANWNNGPMTIKAIATPAAKSSTKTPPRTKTAA